MISKQYGIMSENSLIASRSWKAKSDQLRFHIVDMVYKAQSDLRRLSFGRDIVRGLYFDGMSVDAVNPAGPSAIDSCTPMDMPFRAVCCLAMKGFIPLASWARSESSFRGCRGHPVGQTACIEVTSAPWEWDSRSIAWLSTRSEKAAGACGPLRRWVAQ